MRNCIALIFLILVSPFGFADCEPIAAEGLTEGKPVVKVAPIYPRRAIRKGIEGCVTLGYRLIRKDVDEPRALVASEIEVRGSTEPHRSAFEKAAKKALIKWLFLASTHDESDGVSYYSVVPFELSESE